MALRTIRTQGDPVLAKNCRPVEKMTLRLRMLIGDMFETMYDAHGVGLAAPQVGNLRRIAVIDVDGENPYVFINPEIVEKEGITVSDEEFEKEMEENAKRYGMTVERLKEMLDERQLKQMREDIGIGKAADFIVDNAKETAAKKKKEDKKEEEA